MVNLNDLSGVDSGFLERGFVCIKVKGFALLDLSHETMVQIAKTS